MRRPIVALTVPCALVSGCVLLSQHDYDDQAAKWNAETSGTDSGPSGPDPDQIAMTLVARGTFQMGSPEDEAGRRPDMETLHWVTLTRDYWIGTYEVTAAQYEAFMNEQRAAHRDCADCPVESISWHDAAAFANAVSTAAGLEICYSCTMQQGARTCVTSGSPYDCEGYRLPTQAEWEKAARGGTTSAFSNGGNLHPDDVENCEGFLALDNETVLDDIAVYCGNTTGQSAPVGTKPPNPLGLYDVHGNVWEWTHDYWDGVTDYSGDEVDPWGDPDGSRHAYRGGGWTTGDFPEYQRSAFRYDHDGVALGTSLGMRLARTAPAAR